MTDLFDTFCDESELRCLNFFDSRSPLTIQDDDVQCLDLVQSHGASAMATIYKLIPFDEALTDTSGNLTLRECLHSLYERMDGNESLRRLLQSIDTTHRYITSDHEQFVKLFLSWKSEYSLLAEHPKCDEYICCLLLTVVHNALPDCSMHVLGTSDDHMKEQVMLQIKSTSYFCAQREKLEEALDYVPHCFLSLSVIACVLFLPKVGKDRKDAMQRCLSCCSRLVDDNSSYLRTSSCAGYLLSLHSLLFKTVVDLFFSGQACSPRLPEVASSLFPTGSIALALPTSALSTPPLPCVSVGRCISPASELVRSFSVFEFNTKEASSDCIVVPPLCPPFQEKSPQIFQNPKRMCPNR